MAQGTVYRRGKTWTIVYDLPRVGPGRNQKSIGGFKTKAAAEARRAEIITSLDTGSYIAPTKITLTEFVLVQWLPAMETPGRLKPSTLASYQGDMLRHVLPRIGHLPLRALAAPSLNAMYGDLMREGRKDGKGGLSASTVQQIHRVLRSALADAVRWNLVSRNVADLAECPRGKSAEVDAWTAEEVRDFLTSSTSSASYHVFLLALLTGMRRSELAGLKWDAVDFDTGVLVVRLARTSVGYQVHEHLPKTPSSYRRIPLDDQTLAALQTIRRAQVEMRLRMGSGVAFDYVFSKPDGTPVHPESMSTAFNKAVRKSGVRRIRFHDQRHTHATLGLLAGVPLKVMSERLGHESIFITADLYSHVLPSMQQDATDKIASLILGDAVPA